MLPQDGHLGVRQDLSAGLYTNSVEQDPGGGGEDAFRESPRAASILAFTPARFPPHLSTPANQPAHCNGFHLRSGEEPGTCSAQHRGCSLIASLQRGPLTSASWGQPWIPAWECRRVFPHAPWSWVLPSGPLLRRSEIPLGFQGSKVGDRTAGLSCGRTTLRGLLCSALNSPMSGSEGQKVRTPGAAPHLWGPGASR